MDASADAGEIAADAVDDGQRLADPGVDRPGGWRRRWGRVFAGVALAGAVLVYASTLLEYRHLGETFAASHPTVPVSQTGIDLPLGQFNLAISILVAALALWQIARGVTIGATVIVTVAGVAVVVVNSAFLAFEVLEVTDTNEVYSSTSGAGVRLACIGGVLIAIAGLCTDIRRESPSDPADHHPSEGGQPED